MPAAHAAPAKDDLKTRFTGAILFFATVVTDSR